MPIFTALALIGAGVSVAGSLSGQEEERKQAKFHDEELELQAEANQNIFDVTFPNLIQRNRAGRGLLASSIAKGNVAVGEGSAVTQLSEQARVDSLNESLTLYQHQLQQRGIDVERKLTDRGRDQIRTNQFFTLASGVTSGLSDFNAKGGFA